MDRVRLGVIGLGIMGSLYVKIYSPHPWLKLWRSAPRALCRAAWVRELPGDARLPGH